MSIQLIDPLFCAYFSAHAMVAGGLLLGGFRAWAAAYLIFWGTVTLVAAIKSVKPR